ncbi:MAG TPA: hypothetical protein VMC81_11020 [Rhodocyclaceae bacterium]|nr:hypothetical protein [Rhodocyclaceae bacterium]
MRKLLAISFVLATAPVVAGETPTSAPSAAVVKGTVLEVKDVQNYTYLRLKTADGETWAAVAQAPVKAGAQVAIENPMVMRNFESKALKKTFATIVFGNLAGAAGYKADPAAMAAAHAGAGVGADMGDVHVARAAGANAKTVAEIATTSGQLKDKPVVVHARVVKFNGGIMGKNWVHIRDGSGSAADSSNDLLVTTADSTRIGEVVTVKGIVRTDRDFGAGYAYKVLIEEAALQADPH